MSVRISGEPLFEFAFDRGRWERRVHPAVPQWRRFWQALEKAKVWQWRGGYENPGVADGVAWRLDVARGARGPAMHAEGHNAYPDDDDVGKPNASGEFSRPFAAFYRALEALAGPFPAGAVETAEPLETPVPAATDDLLRRFPDGEVRVEVAVEPDGRHRERMLRGSGDARLDAALLDTLRRWTWKPATAAGKPLLDRRRLTLRRGQRLLERP